MADENLLVNGDFEILDGLGQPSAWFTDAWYTQIGITEYTVDEGRSGNAAVVANYSPNDARFAQALKRLMEEMLRNTESEERTDGRDQAGTLPPL